jgi:hypothetical protein
LLLIVSRGHLRHCLRLGLWLCGSVALESLSTPLHRRCSPSQQIALL